MATKKKNKKTKSWMSKRERIYTIEEIDFHKMVEIIKKGLEKRLYDETFGSVIPYLEESKFDLLEDNFETFIKSLEKCEYGIYSDFFSIVQEIVYSIGYERIRKKYIFDEEELILTQYDEYYKKYLDKIEDIVYKKYNEIKDLKIIEALHQLGVDIYDKLPKVDYEEIYKSIPKEEIKEIADKLIIKLLPESLENIELGELTYPWYEDKSGKVEFKNQKKIEEITWEEYLESYTGNWLPTFESGYGRMWETIFESIQWEINEKAYSLYTEYLSKEIQFLNNEDVIRDYMDTYDECFEYTLKLEYEIEKLIKEDESELLSLIIRKYCPLIVISKENKCNYKG